MTHDELIKRLRDEEQKPYDVDPLGWAILLRVLELHERVGVVCGWCTCYDCDHITMYPCKTVQAIQGAIE